MFGKAVVMIAYIPGLTYTLPIFDRAEGRFKVLCTDDHCMLLGYKMPLVPLNDSSDVVACSLTRSLHCFETIFGYLSPAPCGALGHLHVRPLFDRHI